MESITSKMRGRPVTHDEAAVSAQRLINSHFHNGDQARVSIPARPDNDDILVMDYIEEQRAKDAHRPTCRHCKRQLWRNDAGLYFTDLGIHCYQNFSGWNQHEPETV